MTLFLIFTFTLKNGAFHTKLVHKRDILCCGIIRKSFYVSYGPWKMFCGGIGPEHPRISRATRKIEHLSSTCKQLLIRMLKQMVR